MALPAAGQPISFEDFETEQGFLSGHPPIGMNVQASIYGVGYATDGSNPIGMDEFAGLSAPTYHVYEALLGPGIVTYYVPFSSGNPLNATFGSDCFEKLNPYGIKLGEVVNGWPNATYQPSAGADCGEGVPA